MTHPATLKIACLHGYCQNAQLFRLKTGGLRKSLQRPVSTVRATSSPEAGALQHPMAELCYIDAPFVLERRLNPPPLRPGQRLSEANIYDASFRPASPFSSNASLSDRTKRSWWLSENDGKQYTGFDQTLHYLRDIFREKEFDAILGFSQGAILASLVCALRNDAEHAYPEFSSVRFAIVVSGFPARAVDVQSLYERPIVIPSMHVWGVEDEMVPGSASRLLLEKFDEQDRNCVVHPKGHLVPSDAHSRRAISQFALKFSEELNKSYEERLRAAL